MSSTASDEDYPATSLNDDEPLGLLWGHGDGWRSAGTSKNDDWAQVTFADTQTIHAVTVYSAPDGVVLDADNIDNRSFTRVGVVDFDVQVSNGKGNNWKTVASVVGNALIKRSVSFAPTAAGAVRIVAKAGGIEGTGIVEIEAWGAAGIGNTVLPAASRNKHREAVPVANIVADSPTDALYPASAMADGVTDGRDWGKTASGGWMSAGDASSGDAHVDLFFEKPQVLDAVTVWTLQDDYEHAAAPDDSTMFTKWGLTAFDVQVWRDGWVTVASVKDNHLVKRTVTFAPTAATRLRIVCHSGLAGAARIVELQAWGIDMPGFPRLTGLAPQRGAPGDEITLSGENFSRMALANRVAFNGTAAEVTQASSTALRVRVPQGASSGRLSLTINGIASRTGGNFTVLAASAQTGGAARSAASIAAATAGTGPVINNFYPGVGLPGTVVTIVGSGFDPIPANNDVLFNTEYAYVIAATSTSLTVSAPSAETGYIKVVVNGVEAVSAGYYYFPPYDVYFSPTSGPAETTTLTLTGESLGFSLPTINFTGGISAASYSDGTHLMVRVPAGTQTGPITVTNWTMTSAPSAEPFTVTHPTPTITSFSPTSGYPGDSVTINGTNFSPSTANNAVQFNGVAATITDKSPTGTWLTATVPPTATTGKITVTKDGQTATSPGTFTVNSLPALAATFVSQTAPPSNMSVGQAAAVSVTMKNTGYTTWTAGQGFKLGSVNGVAWGVGQRVVLPNDVPYGKSVTFNFTIVAPSPAGTYAFQWQMLQEGNIWFGGLSSARNVVVDANPVPLTVTGISQIAMTTGSALTLTGTGFSPVASANSVMFTSAPASATVTAASSTSLTVIVPADAEGGTITVTVGSQTASYAGFGVMPSVSGFSPSGGTIGTSVTITGTGFGSVFQYPATVKIGPSALTVSSWSNKVIVGTIPSGAATNTISVKNSSYFSGTSTGVFTIAPPTPTISSISPTSGKAGTTVTFTGTNFSTAANGNVVSFNGVAATTVTPVSVTKLTAVVPPTATTGAVKVSVGASTGTGPTFTVTPTPAATCASVAATLNPIDASASTQRVFAYSVANATDVKFATWWTDGNQSDLQWAQGAVMSGSNWYADVPLSPFTDAGKPHYGKFTTQAYLYNPAYSNNAAQLCGQAQWTWQAPLTITGINPSVAAIGQSITISGSGFSSTPLANAVLFSGDAAYATVTAASANSLTVIVPPGATSGPLSITVNSQTVTTNANVFQLAPQITGFTPTRGPPGTKVTITGNNFGLRQAMSIPGVRIGPLNANGNQLSIQDWSANSITAFIRSGNQSGPFTIYGPDNQPYSSSASFRVTPPCMLSDVGTINLAAAINGGTAISSSTLSPNYPVEAINDCDLVSADWGQGGGWSDATPNDFSDDKVTVKFSDDIGKTISRVALYSLQDNYATAGIPTELTTFTQYGITAFDVLVLTNSGWVTAASVTGNTQVKRVVNITPVKATQVRVKVNNALGGSSRIVELQAWAGADVAPGKPLFSLGEPDANGKVRIDNIRPDKTAGPVEYYLLDRKLGTSGSWDPNSLHTIWPSNPSSGDTVDLSKGPYFYRLRACNSAGCGDATIKQLVSSAPAAPSNLRATENSGVVTLTWDASPGATLYLVRYLDPSGNWVNLDNTNATHAPPIPVSVNGSYTFAVAACNSAGVCSNYATFTLDVTLSSVCVGLNVSTNSVLLTAAAMATQSVTIKAPIGCNWTITTSTDVSNWLSLSRTSGAGDGLGNGATGITVSLTVLSANTGALRGTTLYIDGPGIRKNVDVSQSGAGSTLPLPPSAEQINDAVTHDATVGTMAGQASTDGGAAQYHVPIVVPPGRAGMQPELALVYNSRSGNGVMGMGWTISGLSSIHRCPQTPEQDGQALGVSYSSSDRLCLDGQRLVPVPVTSGLSGVIEYRTEVDSYARITQVGGDIGSGDAVCFRIEQKNGRILHYGGITTASSCTVSTVNSRVKPGGAPRALSWLVEKIEDRVGNNQLYSYADKGNGEVLLDTVKYTGFGADVGDRKVTFAYEPRNCDGVTQGNPCAATGVTDISSSYLAGGLTMQTQALQSITTKVDTITVRTYTPTYTAAAYNQRLQMMSLKECASDADTTSCHPATQFTYNDSAPNFSLDPNNDLTLSAAISSGVGDGPSNILNVPDLDGDGSRESLLVVGRGDLEKIYLVQFSADRKVRSAVDVTGQWIASGCGPQGADGCGYTGQVLLRQGLYADMDGDGRAEVVRPPMSAGESQYLSLLVWNRPRGAAVAMNDPSPFTQIPTNIPYSFNGSGNQGGESIFPADVNGDGKIDIVTVVQDAANCGSSGVGPKSGVYVYLNNVSDGVLGAGLSSANFVIPNPNKPLFCLDSTASNANSVFSGWAESIDHVSDFDGDGLPDFFIKAYDLGKGKDFISRIVLTKKTGSSLGTKSETCTQIGLTSHLNADGTPASDDECNGNLSGGQYFATWTDVNGDGLEDFLIAKSAASPVWLVRLNKGDGTFGSSIGITHPDGTPADDGLDTRPSGFRYAGQLPQMDADGDGKPDLLVVSRQNKFAVKVCQALVRPKAGVDVTCPGASSVGISLPIRPASLPAGEQPLVSNACVYYSCPRDPGSGPSALNMPLLAEGGGDGSGFTFNHGYPSESGGTLPVVANDSPQGSSVDNSVYHLAQLKFVQTGADTIVAQVTETSLISKLISSANKADDIHGNGLPSLVTEIGCHGVVAQIRDSATPPVYYNACRIVAGGGFGPDKLADGTQTDGPTVLSNGTSISGFATQRVLFVNTNKGVASANAPPQATVNSVLGVTGQNCPAGPILPGLLFSATNGLGDVAQWGYDTLALGRLCKRDGVAEYSTVDENGAERYYGDARHYYFASSMPVVSAMIQSNGIGTATGSRSAAYGYSEAMYNHLGRGFQGFHKITVENASSDASRRLITTTTFNQKFPLVGKVDKVSTYKPGDPTHSVHAENTTYSCIQSNGDLATCPQSDSASVLLTIPTANTVQRPVAAAQTSSDSDLATGAASGHSTTSNSSWDIYGNLLVQTVTRGDDASGGMFVQSHTTTTTNTYDTALANVSGWWIGKLSASSVQTSVSYAVAPPDGTDTSAKTLTTQFTWNTDRTPATKTVQKNVPGQESTTTYTYPATSYGLPTQVQVNAVGLDPALSPIRSTSYTYSKDGKNAAADGYFVRTMTNALNQTTTTTVQQRDGQVTLVTDRNGILTGTTYDVFGRATQITHQTPASASPPNADIEPPIYIGLTNCGNNGCSVVGLGHDANDAGAVYRMVTAQKGYPTKVAWYDLLGRPIKQAQAGFSGTTGAATPKLQYSYSATLTQYDENGTARKQSAPYYVGSDTPSYTEFGYDALNRVTQKSAPAACSGGTMDTTYAYVGRRTNIVASGSCPGGTSNAEIRMSRSTNVLGQLMQTMDANGKTTSYWTEPQGHMSAIQDVEGNVTKAEYNELGQRTKSIDPDQGTWTFTYDALGELKTQKDARNVTTTVTARDALGRELRRQAVPLANAPASLSGEAIVDTTSYDPANAKGQIGTQTRSRGSDLTTLSNNPQVWQQTTAYDPAARPSTVTTRINDGVSTSFTSKIDYDAYGRLDKHTYPSVGGDANGLTVRHRYTGYGQLDALSNVGTDYVYWTAQAQNAWGHVTQEQYPGVITGNHHDDPATGQTQILNWTGTRADRFDYTYDGFGNLVKQQRQTAGATVSESYTYDVLQRLKTSGRVLFDGTHPGVNYSYSDSGNLTQKSDWSNSYTYADAGTNTRNNGCGPHAASGTGGIYTYACDENGNVVGGNTLSAVYDAENRAKTITRTATGALTRSGQMGWSFGANGQMAVETSSQGTRLFGPDGYEQIGDGATATQVHELGPVIVTRSNDGLGHITDTVSVVLRDRLGSTMSVIENGGLPTTRAYDAFGKARNGDFSDRPNGTLDLVDDLLGGTIHGFTKHDHADDVALIHMGGRVYDQNLGRFLQVDPIAHADHSQGLNPYSYIFNNPLAGKDPTGYDVSCPSTGEVGKTVSCTYTPIGSHISQSATGVVGKDGNVTFSGSNAMGGMLISGNSFVGVRYSVGTNGAATAQSAYLGSNKNGYPDPTTVSCTQLTPTQSSATPAWPAPTSPSDALNQNATDAERSFVNGNPFAGVSALYWNADNYILGALGNALGWATGSWNHWTNEPAQGDKLVFDGLSALTAGTSKFAGAALGRAFGLETTTLYRAVSVEELKSIASSGGFGAGPSSMGNKWFAESASDASAWGRQFYSWDRQPFFTVRVQIPNDLANQMLRNPRLDNIGPARSADAGLLQQINARAKIDALNGNVVP